MNHPRLESPVEFNGVVVEPEFAEAFDMKMTRVILTAADQYWLDCCTVAMTGFGTSVVGCGIEIAVERQLSPSETPDGRVGVAVLAFAMSGKQLDKQIPNRIGQCVLTCPTAAAFAGIDPDTAAPEKRVPMGKTVRYFGDGDQISKRIDVRDQTDKHLWRIPVMDGEFLCEHSTARTSGIGGGNFLLLCDSVSSVAAATRAAVAAIATCDGVITPFPGGAARSGSKVGSKYDSLSASTNTAFCPTLRGRDGSLLADDEHAVLEVVIDGVDFESIAAAIRTGILAACQTVGRDGGLLRITAGNYGGDLGSHHFHLHDVLA